MPRGDKTGPYGDGPMTGRRLGYCTGNDMPGFDTVHGSNLGHGFGGRLGRRHAGEGRMGYRFRHRQGYLMDETIQNVSKETLLENEARILKDQLASIEKQLSNLKKKDE